MYPDFLVIGAQKAGTTWLYENLRKHPGIWMPKEKELHYFDEKIRLDASLGDKLRGEREIDRRWRRQVSRQLRGYREDFSPRRLPLKDLAWDLRYFLGTPDDKWYASLFEQGRGKITGETTPGYSILGARAVSHIYEIMPETRIIFMMRNPMERAWSQAMMGRSRGGPLSEVPDEKFRRDFDSKRSRMYSNYLRTLNNWGTVFPKEQIFIGFLEDVHFYPTRLLRRVYRFLGADIAADYPVVRRRVHTRQVETIPTRLATELAVIYREDLEKLNRGFGGYADFWRYCAERLAEDPPADETIPYPFWESFLWRGWVSTDGEPFDPRRQDVFQSGVLSAVLTRANDKN